jgi:D-alanyl-D-alanine carboxypeptidase
MLVACLAAIAGAACLVAPALANRGPAESTAKVQRALDEVVAAGAPGAIALIRDGDRTQQLSSGYGNLAPLTPIRVSDRSRIGGVSPSSRLLSSSW